MKKLLFGIHCHQPFGNFDHVVIKAINECYRPFLKTLNDHHGVRAVVHVSGCLFDFFENHSPDLMDLLKDCADRKQIELLGGGYYEPILPLWPERDQSAQLLKMKSYISEKFDQDPDGMWLTERVWEPKLPSVIARSGYRATFLDDSHFLASGLTQEQIHGYFKTEDEGKEIAIFPINKSLRYMIPFKHVSAVEEFFRSGPEMLLTMVDDGEKFGVWPGTAKWVYKEGWLEAFFSFLDKTKDVETISLKDALELKEEGIVYLPTTSYEEMEEWTLPAKRQVDLRRTKSACNDESARGLIRGGFFRNFFSKYEESRRLYLRLLSLGEHLEISHPFFDEYLKAQCNCAYWHGIFGGLYLPHLRHALWKQVVTIDRALGRTGSRNCLRTEKIQVFPSEDGTIREIDDFQHGSNLVNTLRRRIEGYHLLAEERKRSSREASSIHEEIRAVPEELARHILNDTEPLDVLRDHILSSFDEEQSMAKAMIAGERKPFRKNVGRIDERSIMSLEGEGFSLRKEIRLKRNHIIAKYSWRNVPQEIHHLISSNFFILDGFYQLEKNGEKISLDKPSKGMSSSVLIKDTVENIDLTILLPEPVFTCVLPVMTVSLSESGYDCIRQAMAVFIRAPGQKEFEIHIIIGG